MPTFRQIEAFQAVMTNGSVTKAADALGLGQPAVSRLIADLEEAVGLRLFVRTARSLVPTTKARELAREVERSFLGMNHICSTARRLAESDHGAVRIAVVPSLLDEIVPELLGPFTKAHPEIGVSLEVATTLETAELLSTVNCDFGITNEHTLVNGLNVQVVARRAAECAMPRRHRLAQFGRPLKPEDFEGERFVSFMPTSGFRRQIDKIFDAAQVRRDLRYEARTTAAACEMVLALDAVTILPVAPRIDPGSRLRLLPFQPELVSQVALLRQRHRTLTPAAEQFAAFVGERLHALGGQKLSLTRGSAQVIKSMAAVSTARGRRRAHRQGAAQ